MEAIITLAPTVSTVAAERIQAELKRTFLEGDAARGYTLLALTGVLNVVLPDLGRQTDTVVCQALSQAQPKTFGEVLSILAAETPQTNAEDTVQSVSDRLRLSRDDREMFHYCMTRRAALGRDKTSLANRLRLVRQKRFNHFARVEDARRTALGLPTDELKALVRLKNAKTEEKLHPRPLLTGKDLMALGYSPGPHFKHMLLTLEDAQLEGRVSSREEAIQLVAEANSALD